MLVKGKFGVFVWCILLLAICHPALGFGGPTNWGFTIDSMNFPLPWLGVRPWSQDGYDGQSPFAVPPDASGIAVLHYRVNGPAWSGVTGFYTEDYESPIPSGGNKTWDSIYLWAQNFPVPEGQFEFRLGPDYGWPPSYYTARLVLDYVPQSLGWAGPTEYELRMDRSYRLMLPVPVTTDPLTDGVRMHITVSAVPEPSSLLALGGGALGIVGFALGRRRRG